MRIYTRAGDLAFKTFDFPDSQPHFKLETYEREFGSVTVELAIKCPRDLFMLLLVSSVLRQHGYAEVNLDIRYLMAARMDRAISSMEPFSLAVVAQMINSCGLTRVRILDVHSEVATRLIRNSVNVLPFAVVEQIKTTLGRPLLVCAPDKGATERTRALAKDLILQCSKKRDMATGMLSGFEIADPSWCRTFGNILIVDDICDGGNTFIGLAKELRKAGAKKVYLFVTHNVQKKQFLEGIDKIYTTDSFYGDGVLASGPWSQWAETCVIPVSMKELQ